MPQKCPKNPIFGILDPLFCTFFAKNARGEGRPLFRGGPPQGGVPGVRAEPPLEGAPEERTGGCEKSPQIFPKNSPMNFFTTQLLWGTKNVSNMMGK